MYWKKNKQNNGVVLSGVKCYFLLPPFNISRNIDFQPRFLKIGWTKINFDNGFEFLRSFS